MNLVEKIIPYSDSDKALSFLCNAVVPSVQHLLLNSIPCLFKYGGNSFIRSPSVMREKTSNILKQKHLRLELFQESCVVVKQRPSRIFQPQFFPCVGKGLTRRTTGKQVEFTLFQRKVILQVEARNVRYIVLNYTPLRSVFSERVASILIELKAS